MRLRLLLLSLFALALTATRAEAATVSCAGVPAYANGVVYAAGAQVTYQGSLYQAATSIWNAPPDYCPACGWWTLVGTCGSTTPDTTPPTVPTGLAASAVTGSSLTLSWTASTDAGGSGVVGYDVYRGGALLASPTGTSQAVTGLSASTAYSFTVRARDAAGNASAQSAPLSVTTGAPSTCTTLPAAPTGLSASGLTSSAVTLSWSASTVTGACAVTGYRVYQDGAQAAALGGTSASISGLAASTAYAFTVAAVNAYGLSPQSAPLSVTTLPSGGGGCAVQSAPAGKVLVGYWESWDNSGVHPGMGWIPLSQVPAGYNVLALAFPVILPDGTAKWETGMDAGVKVPSPDEICAEKAKGRRLLLSIGGANAAIDLSSSVVADRFVATIVPILQQNHFDGIDIDIESGLVAGASFSALSTSQANLVRIIDGVLAQMPAGFMLTMAPETAYVTGGQIAYGGPWGAYAPIIQRYLANGRLSWLQMQYYNGSMYGPNGTTYAAGTVDGFVQQTLAMMNGFTVAGTRITIPASQIVVGLPAQPGAASSGYMAPALVTQAWAQVSGIRGLMTWSINWDGSKGWTFLNTKPF
jgi:chitinase/chitodextrinase